MLIIAGQTVAEMEFGAEPAGWGAARRTGLAAVVGTAEISWRMTLWSGSDSECAKALLRGTARYGKVRAVRNLFGLITRGSQVRQLRTDGPRDRVYLGFVSPLRLEPPRGRRGVVVRSSLEIVTARGLGHRWPAG